MHLVTTIQRQKQAQNMAEQANLRIAIAIKDSDLDNEGLQEATQNLREQIEESEIVERADWWQSIERQRDRRHSAALF